MRRASGVYVIAYVAVAAWAPYLAPYYQSLGISLGAIGLLMAMASAVSLVSAPLWGTIHDRFPESRALIPVATAIGACGAFGLATVGASPLLVPSAAAFAVGMSGTFPMMDVRVLDITAADRTRYARVRVWGSVSFIIAAPLVGLLINGHGPGSLFWVVIPALLAGGLATVLLPVRANAIKAPSLRLAPRVVLGHRPIALFLIGALVAWTAVGSQNTFFSIYLRQLGASSDQIGWAWSIAALTEVPAMFLFPVLARRFGVERLIVIGALILVVRQVANVAFTETSLLIVFSLIQGIGYSFLLIGGVTFVSRQAPKGTAATAQGILTAVASSLAQILGSGLGGQLAGLLTIRGLYVVSTCLGATAVIVIALAVLPATRTAAEVASPTEEAGSPELMTEAVDEA
jgi:PPP family 3-phenylpropionic acid transporter